MKVVTLLAFFSAISLVSCHPLNHETQGPSVTDPATKVTFQGARSNDVESFLNIRFGHDTSGANRFAHPIPFTYSPGSIVDASIYGAACPQQRVPVQNFNIFQNVTNISEDCLTLRIDRPANTTAADKLPVMVWIYGGGDTIGQIYDQAYNPAGLILGSAAQGTPIIFVAMNYRLGVFGFAATPALNATNSLNAGLLDQRLALSWVQEHIHVFGGDPEKVTIFGESDGAESVALHITAYGGEANERPPFQRAIMESGAATEDAGIANGLVAEHTANLISAVNCTSRTSNSTDELACLRMLPLDTLLPAAVTYERATGSFGFDVFFPSAPSPFIPDAPSKLLRSGKFAHDISLISGWNENDGSLFVPSNLSSEGDTLAWLQVAFPNFDSENIETLLKLYPSDDFQLDSAANASTQYFRAAQIFRDSELTCTSLLIAQSMARFSEHDTTSTYFYTLNASSFTPFFVQEGVGYLGVSHFSDIPFVFNQASQLQSSAPLVQLASQMSGAWAAFATHGDPSAQVTGHVLGGWSQAVPIGDPEKKPYGVRVFGGPQAGEMVIGEEPAPDHANYGENLLRRCGFWNSEAVLAQLGV